MMFGKILLLADDSRRSWSVVQQGYELAAKVGAQVVLVCVVDAALAIGDVDAGIFPEEAMKTLIATTRRLLDGLKAKYSSGIGTEILMPVGEVKKVIPEIVKQTGANLIVISTHHRSVIDRLIEGSLAESVLRISSVPVMIVPVK